MIKWIEDNLAKFIIYVLIFAVVAPFLFTRIEFLGFNFADTGPIGDTIGGITAPILNFLGIILLYLTLKSQNDSIRNQDEELRKQTILINNQRDSETIHRRLISFREDLENFKIPGSSKVYSGANAFYLLAKGITGNLTCINPSLRQDEVLGLLHRHNSLLINLKNLFQKNYNSSLSIIEKVDLYRELMVHAQPVIKLHDKLIDLSSYFDDKVTAEVKEIFVGGMVRDVKSLFDSFNPINDLEIV